MTELHLFMSIFEREDYTLDLQYYEQGQEFQLTIKGLYDSSVVMYFDKDGKFKECLGEN